MIRQFFHWTWPALALFAAIEPVAAQDGLPPDYLATHGRDAPVQSAPRQLGIEANRPAPVCRPDQVLIGGKACGCPSQHRAKLISPGVWRCLPG